MEVVGTAASILGIADVVARSLIKLRDIQKRMQDSDIVLLSLVGELAATDAALTGLRACVLTTNGNEQSYVALLDLESSLTACQLLVNIIDTKISSLHSIGLSPASMQRLRVVLADGELGDHLSRLGRIISALNIVRDTLFRTPLAQQRVLRDDWNREILDKVREDSASMIVLCDASSLKRSASQSLSTGSSLSLRFPELDEILLELKAYRQTLHALLHRFRTNKSNAKPVADGPPPRASDPSFPSVPLARRGTVTSIEDDRISESLREVLNSLNIKDAKDFDILEGRVRGRPGPSQILVALGGTSDLPSRTLRNLRERRTEQIRRQSNLQWLVYRSGRPVASEIRSVIAETKSLELADKIRLARMFGGHCELTSDKLDHEMSLLVVSDEDLQKLRQELKRHLRKQSGSDDRTKPAGILIYLLSLLRENSETDDSDLDFWRSQVIAHLENSDDYHLFDLAGDRVQLFPALHAQASSSLPTPLTQHQVYLVDTPAKNDVQHQLSDKYDGLAQYKLAMKQSPHLSTIILLINCSAHSCVDRGKSGSYNCSQHHTAHSAEPSAFKQHAPWRARFFSACADVDKADDVSRALIDLLTETIRSVNAVSLGLDEDTSESVSWGKALPFSSRPLDR